MSDPFPASDLDDVRRLLRAAGSFWSDTYQGTDLVESLLYARGRLDRQADTAFRELLDSVSRLKVPVLKREEWHLVTLRESERDSAAGNFASLDGVYTFSGEISYDVPVDNAYHAWPAPAALRSAPLLADRITSPRVTLLHGVDFVLRGGGLWFRDNPFDDDAVEKVNVFEGGEVVDREVRLWLHNSGWERDNVHLQFGYVLGLKLPSTRTYRDLVNAVFDALVEGTSARSVQELFSACCDVPLARGNETVERTYYDRKSLWVVTDKNAYRLHPDDEPVVAAGDELAPGAELGTALRFYEFNRGQLPDDLRAVALSPRFLVSGFYSDLVFENKTVDLVVEEDVDGYTKVSFEVGGFPADVEKFWGDVHANGVAAGQTLAMLLDRRPESARGTQPTALALPATVNPLGFLTANVLRNNYFVVKLRPTLFGPEALGLGPARLLGRIVPPHTACVIVSEITRGDAITMDGPGDETAPGYEERVLTYAGTTVTEAIDGGDMIEESVRCYQVGGHCE
jgi:hypothetical protein